jgi:hypothetical protein
MMADRCRWSAHGRSLKNVRRKHRPLPNRWLGSGFQTPFRAEYEKIAIRIGTFPSAAKFDKNRIGDVDA